jgi:hypothetical protein
MADQMTDRESAQEWQHFAQMDLNSAEFLMQIQPLPTEIICYHKYSVHPKEIDIDETQLKQAIVDAKIIFEYIQRFFQPEKTSIS